MRETAQNRVASSFERGTGARPALNLTGTTPQAPAPDLGARTFSPNELRAQLLRPPQATALADANAHFSRFSYSDEAPDGSTAAAAIAENALSNETATGTDGDLNCVEAAVEGQEFFAERGVETEIVVADDHAVLRMPDGTYYDPTTQSLVPESEAAPYDGVDGITVDERERLESEARTAADALGPDATPEARRE
ncbi:hypothetical protein ACLESO_52780, partial [Pyxidicoccus sp. 3LG]